jgi:hypothetical protein
MMMMITTVTFVLSMKFNHVLEEYFPYIFRVSEEDKQ